MRMALLLGLVFAASAYGQSDSLGRANRLCWLHVRPAPACAAFVVTEVGVEHPAYTSRLSTAGPGSDDYFSSRVTFGAGMMFNAGARRAIGGVAAWDKSGASPLRGELRFRTWRGIAGYDLALGAARYDRDLDRATGLTGGIGVESVRIAADLRIALMSANGRPVRGVFASGRLTSINAPVALAAIGLVRLLWPKPGTVF